MGTLAGYHDNITFLGSMASDPHNTLHVFVSLGHARVGSEAPNHEICVGHFPEQDNREDEL